LIEIQHQVKKIRDGLARLEALVYAHRERHQLNGGDPLELDASQIISGTFDVARIPDLDASKIVSGVFDIARIPDIPRSKVPDFWDAPFWDNIPDKPSTFPPSAHASTHLAGGSDDLESHLRLAKLYERSHNSLTDVTAFQHHGDWAHYGKIPTTAPTGANERAYVDSANLYVHNGTSWVLRATKDWNNLINKPSTFPPEAHTHPRSDITDFWNSPFWDNIPDKPSTFPPSAHGRDAHTIGLIPSVTADPTAAEGDLWYRSDIDQLRIYTTAVKQVFPADWGDITNKPSTFPPSAHASSHEAGGSDQITGWIRPSHIGPYSDTEAYLYFRTRDIAGTSNVHHRFAPSDDGYGRLGTSDHRWFVSYVENPYWWYGYARGVGPTRFPYDASTHHTLRPETDAYSYVGTETYRFNLVRAVTITSGDLGFEEDRCMVCGKPFKLGDSIVLKVRKIDKEHRQILTVPVHAECNPHEFSEEMLRHHEELLKPRKNPQDELRYKMPNPEVKFEIVWEQPINEELMYVQANFEDGITVCPIVQIEATEEEVVNTIKEHYLREKHRLIQEKSNREKGEQKLKKLGKTWKGKKFTIRLYTGNSNMMHLSKS